MEVRESAELFDTLGGECRPYMMICCLELELFDLCKIFGSKELLYVELDAVRYVDGDSFDGGEGVCRNRGEWIGGMYVYVECLKLWPGMERKRL